MEIIEQVTDNIKLKELKEKKKNLGSLIWAMEIELSDVKKQIQKFNKEK